MNAAPLSLPGDEPVDILHAVATATTLPMAYVSWPQAGYVWCNTAYAQLLQMPLHQLLGQPAQHVHTAGAWPAWQGAFERLVQTGAPNASLRLPLPFAQQPHTPCQLVAHQRGGQVSGIVVLPVPELSVLQAQQMVQDSDTRMRHYAQATHEALIFLRHGRIVEANPAALRLTGYPWHQLQKRTVLQLLPPSLHAPLVQALEQGSTPPLETRLLCHNGQEREVDITVHLLPEADGGDGALLVLRDITPRKRAEAQLHFLAFHDPLTRLPNRQGLMQQLRQMVQHAQQHQQPLAVLYVDVDRFKDVNDSLGHDAGDSLLIATARRLRSKVHPDDLVARLAGDEFVVVLSSPLTAADPACVLRELRFVLNKAYALPHGLVHLPASMGVSRYPQDGSTAEALMLNASAAMATAKRLGQGHSRHYHARMEQRPSRLLAQDRLLREAVAHNQGLLLYYQPQWNVSSNRLEGFEALVRWQHPERGLLPPAEFIAFAESRGLIALIDRWVLRAACQQLRAWQDAQLPPVVVSVNMSPNALSQRDVVCEVQQTLSDTGVAAQWLEIELTESTLMQQSAHVQDTLKALQQLGVRLSMDDFGTGYSSLAYLKRYPLDKIKIDRAFVKDTPEDADDVAIVAAIIQMAHSLHLRVVAEGVETQAQWKLLEGLGCDLVQGYYLARPLSADDALRWQHQQPHCHLGTPQ